VAALRTRRLAPLAIAATAGLVLAACGDDDDSDAAGDALDGVSVTVGSKDFTENILLGEMLVLALENEGADVTNQVNLGGTVVNRESLENGDIDVYPEYNGTGWTVHLGNEDPSNDPTELYEVTAEADLDENGIRWVGTSPFNNTYGFVSSPEATEENGGAFDVESMFEYVNDNPDASVCMESEFPDRPDGLVLFEEFAGSEIPDDQQQILDTGLIYTETEANACTFGEVFTTDGRIEALDITLVEDPGAAILYNVSYTWDDETYQEAAETLEDISVQIIDSLDQETMASLNAQVDVDGDPAEDVAQAHLEEIGLL